MPSLSLTILYAALNCCAELLWVTYDGSREQDRPTLSRTGSEPRIVSVASEKPFPENFTLGDSQRPQRRSAGLGFRRWSELSRAGNRLILKPLRRRRQDLP